MFNITIMIFETTKVIFIILFQDLNFSKMYRREFSSQTFPMHKNHTP